jgi:hypothetical protein
MSSQNSTTGNVLGTIGAVVGAIFGGPVGAAQGYAIGSSIGNAIDPPKGPTVSGPRLADLAVQTSTYGSFIPRIYGTVPLHGNLMWLENGKIKETVRKKKQGGKGGGGGTTVKTYTYSATFAIGLCEGPIAGIRRIWCLDKLIYNAGSDDLETIIASNQAATGWRLYLGTDDQEPDPRYEADVGVGNAPAFRGMAYIVFDDFQLADYNNSLQSAQFKFEVVDDASGSISLLSNKTGQYSRNSTSQALIAKPYFISAEKVVFYAPQWNITWPSTGNAIRYEVRPSGAITQSIKSYTGLGYPAGPPNGFTDDDDEFWPNSQAVFNGSSFVGTGPDGYILRAGGVYCGISDTGGRKIYSRTDSSPANMYGTIISSAKVIASDGDVIYAILDSTLNIYDKNLSLVSSISASIPASITYPTARAVFYKDKLRIYDGAVTNPKIYDLDTSSGVYTEKYSIPTIVGDFYYSTNIAFENEIFVRTYQLSATNSIIVEWFNLESQTYNLVSLGSIVSSEFELSSIISPTDLDVSLISDEVRGYRVQGGSIRSALEPLQAIWPFDVRPHGYQLQCLPRGQSSVATINYEELGAGDTSESGDLLPQSREMDSQLPASTHVKFWDAAREYADSEQYADRPGTDAVNRVDREFPIVLTATEGAKAADVLQQLPWLERTTFEFSLPPTYGELEPGDVVTINTPGSVYSLRLTEISDSISGVRQCKARPNNPALYLSNAVGGEGVVPPGTIPLAGPSLFVPMDIPLVDEVSQNTPGFASAMTGYTDGWPGAVAVRSTDNGQTFDDLQAYAGKGAIAVATTTLGSHAGYLIQQASLTISVISGDFESITQDQLLNGYNYAAYGVNGRWEIVRFQNATLNSDATVTLDTFVRGDKGTEWATGLHQIGDYFVLLDDADNAFIGMAIQSIGVESLYRGVTSGASVDDADDVLFTYNGVNLETLSPVSAQAFRDGSSNLTATFYRRSRLGNTWWNTGVQSPIGETTESYEIDVMNGSTVVRTISVTSPAFSYSAANQTTDFGSPQSSIVFRIYQLSEVVGRGYVYEVTL